MNHWNQFLVRERPDVWIWYFNIWARSLAPYFFFMAFAQILRATRPITAYSGSTPFEKAINLVQNHWCSYHDSNSIYISETIWKCKCQLRNWICPCFGNMISWNRNRIKFLTFLVMKYSWTSPINRRANSVENTSILRLIFFLK
jgi:hypothetical protein